MKLMKIDMPVMKNKYLFAQILCQKIFIPPKCCNAVLLTLGGFHFRVISQVDDLAKITSSLLSKYKNVNAELSDTRKNNNL